MTITEKQNLLHAYEARSAAYVREGDIEMARMYATDYALLRDSMVTASERLAVFA